MNTFNLYDFFFFIADFVKIISEVTSNIFFGQITFGNFTINFYEIATASLPVLMALFLAKKFIPLL